MGSNKVVRHDCIIAEGGCPGEPYAHAIGLTYKVKSDDTIEFAKEPIYVGTAMNYMLNLYEFEDGEEDSAESEAAE